MSEEKKEVKSLEEGLETEIARLESESEESEESKDDGQSDQEEPSTSKEDTSESQDDSGNSMDDKVEAESPEKEESETDDEEIPKETSAAFKKANRWRSEAKIERESRLKLEKEVAEIKETLKHKNPEEMTDEEREYVNAKQQVESIVKQVIYEEQKKKTQEIQEFDNKVQEMIDNCEEEFGTEFKANEALDFATKWQLTDLRQAHLLLKQMKKNKDTAVESTKQSLLKKKTANLPVGGGLSTIGRIDPGITKNDDISAITEKILKSGLIK